MNNQKRHSSMEQNKLRKSLQSGRKVSHSAITYQRNSLQITMVSNIVQCLAKKKVYVEIFTGPLISDRNQSDIEDEVLYALGATIVKRLSKHTHYLVWQYGYLSTLEKAKEWNVKIVSPMWVNECLAKKKEIECALFPIIDLTNQELQELQKRDKVNQKKIKQSNVLEEIDEFNMRPIYNSFKQQLLLIQADKDYVSIFKKNETQIESETEQIEISQKRIETEIKKVAIHKSCDNDVLSQFENLKEGYQLVFEEEQKLKCDILVVDENKLQYDLLFCYCCLNKHTQIVSQRWILNHQNLNSCYLQYNLAKKILFSQNFHVQLPRTKTQHQKIAQSLIKQAIETVICHFGGKITSKEYCDILLVKYVMFKSTAQQIYNTLPNLKIIHAEWIYKSIQNGKLIDLSEYIV